MAKIICWLPLVLGTFILTKPEVASQESGEQRVETASECKLSRWKEMLAELCHVSCYYIVNVSSLACSYK